MLNKLIRKIIGESTTETNNYSSTSLEDMYMILFPYFPGLTESDFDLIQEKYNALEIKHLNSELLQEDMYFIARLRMFLPGELERLEVRKWNDEWEITREKD